MHAEEEMRERYAGKDAKVKGEMRVLRLREKYAALGVEYVEDESMSMCSSVWLCISAVIFG